MNYLIFIISILLFFYKKDLKVNEVFQGVYI